MRNVQKKGVVAGVAVLVLGAGSFLMWPAAAATRGHRQPAAAEGTHRPAAERPASLNELNLLAAGQANLQCVNTASGVKLIIITDQPRQVARLQQQVRARVERLGQASEHAGRRAGRARSLIGLIASGKVKIAAENVDKGAAITLSSSDPDVVKRLQAEVPRMVEARKELQAAIEQQRQFNRLLASGQVKVDVQQTEGGVTVSIVASDPKLAAEIKDKLPAYFEGLPQRARLIEQYTGGHRAARAPAPAHHERAPHHG